MNDVAESPWNWSEVSFKDQKNREWWVRYLDWVDHDHHVEQTGPAEYSVGLSSGEIITCSSHAEVEKALTKDRDKVMGRGQLDSTNT